MRGTSQRIQDISITRKVERGEREGISVRLVDGLVGLDRGPRRRRFVYVRAPPKELLRLRSLLARGRARERKVRTRRTTPREVALLFAPTFPNELFWKVATYWNPRYEALVNARNNN